MKLRNHSLVCSNGIPTWPPTWWWRGGEDNKHPLGDIGVLKYVIRCSIKPSTRCYLIMEYEGAEYLGILRFDSYSVCQRVYGFLLQHRGESIQEIGEIDLDSVYEERSANEVKGRERLKLAHFIKTGFHNGR